MPDDAQTFGGVISQKRKELGLSQKDLAARIQREEGGGQISPQYLNDIEHDRRNPSSDHIIGEFARELSLSPNILYFLAGRIPSELRSLPVNERLVDIEVGRIATAFRRGTSPRR